MVGRPETPRKIDVAVADEEDLTSYPTGLLEKVIQMARINLNDIATKARQVAMEVDPELIGDLRAAGLQIEAEDPDDYEFKFRRELLSLASRYREILIKIQEMKSLEKQEEE